MQARRPISTQPCTGQESRDSSTHHAQVHSPHLLTSPLLHPAHALHRKTLVSELFKHVREIRSLDSGYAFRFDRSDNLEELLGKLAEYIVCESLQSPQLTFTIDEEPKTKGFWLQVWSREDQVPEMALATVQS